MSNRYPYSDFIKEANKIHNSRFEYKESSYKGKNSKIDLKCKTCFYSWSQLCSDHLKGFGCPSCSGKLKHTKESYIETANRIYNNFYNYEKIVYKNNKIPIIISCPLHGDFSVVPNHHLSGTGCLKCNREGSVYDTESFILKANKIHNNKYDYSITEYIGYNKYLSIKCSIHGFFKKLPSVHLRGSGCPKCKNQLQHSNKELELMYWLNSLGYNFKHSSIPNSKFKLDLYDEDLKLAIEFNGNIYHHSTDNIQVLSKYRKETNYHLQKYLLCKQNEINLIHIFEFESLEKMEKKIKFIFKVS